MTTPKQPRHATPVATTSAPLAPERLDALRDLIPEAFGEAGVDWDKLKAALGETVDDRPDRYRFEWAGKRDAIALLQRPSTATLVPVPEESINFDTTRHVFIEGENLEALKLLYKPYAGRVKMIYIDPPYNTGNDFIYRDDYSRPLQAYLEQTGQAEAAPADARGAAERASRTGRIHSDWLNMMYPRLFLARQLLRDDGVIFISCDDNEVHHLRVLMNELFGEENFVVQVVWQNVYGGGAKSKHAVPQHEYVLAYARSVDALGPLDLPPSAASRERYTERDERYDTRGPYFTQPLATTSMDFRPNLRFPITWEGEEIWPDKQWQWSKERVQRALENNDLVIRRDGEKWSVRYKQYLRDEAGEERGSKLYSVMKGPWSQVGTAEIAQLFGDGKVFPFPKPTALIKHLLSALWTDPEALILDFFAGSGPTGQAVWELNDEFPGSRRFILIQMPEPIPKDSPAQNMGLATVSDVCRERLKRTVKSAQAKRATELDLQEADLGFAVFRLTRSSFISWGAADPTQQATDYVLSLELQLDPLSGAADAKDVIHEVALKEAGMSLSARFARVESVTTNAVYRVTDPEDGRKFHICLDDRLHPDTPKALDLRGDADLFVCRDVALDDTLAANLALQCRLRTL